MAVEPGRDGQALGARRALHQDPVKLLDEARELAEAAAPTAEEQRRLKELTREIVMMPPRFFVEMSLLAWKYCLKQICGAPVSAESR